MLYIVQLLNRLQRDDRGASAVEYAILVGVIGVALATGAKTFGDGLSGVFSNMLSSVKLS